MSWQAALQPLSPARAGNLAGLLEASGPEPAACHCTAYHGIGGERPTEARACRARLAGASPADGFLLYNGAEPVLWAQCAPWDTFAVLRARPQPPGTWALTCVVVPPGRRRSGLVHELLRRLPRTLSARGAVRLVAFAHRLGPTYSSPLPELPERACLAAGMRLERDDAECPLYALDLASALPD